MSSRRCKSCVSGYNWTIWTPKCTVLTTDEAPFRHRQTIVLATARPPSRPTDPGTVLDRRSVGLLWRSEIIGTVGDRREVERKSRTPFRIINRFLARITCIWYHFRKFRTLLSKA